MAFNSDDLYTVSGGANIFNYWNPFVTKHDSSSFYNWEQDNLPLYDVEERTYYLWEKFGYPLSGVPSMALLVSSTIPIDTAASANIFTSVSAAIESLPEIIRMPTLIEVAVSGHIGSIELNNIKCEDDGALEIINRGFAPLTQWPEISGTISDNQTFYLDDDMDAKRFIPSQVSGHGIVSYINDSSAVAFSSTTAGLWDFTVSEKTFYRVLAMPVSQTSSLTARPSKSSYSYPGVSNFTNAITKSGNTLNMSPICTASFPGTKGPVDGTIDLLDVSTYNDLSGAFLVRPQPVDHDQMLNGTITANRVSQVKLQNCDGPIYVRGFIVDGYDDVATAYETSVGIGVYNSTDVSIEDCGAMRCTQAGYEIDNSKVKLRRRNIASRNYDTTLRATSGYESYGFKISNSEVEYKVDNKYSVGMAALLASHFHTYGIHLNNSKLFGGGLSPELAAAVTNTTLRTVTPLEVGYNNYGIYADSSKYDIQGLTDVYNNETNIKANSSEFRTGSYLVDNANQEGVDFNNSRFVINTDFNEYLRNTGQDVWGTAANDRFRKFGYGTMSENRRHMLLNNGSYYGPDYPVELSAFDNDVFYTGTSSLANNYNRVVFAEAWGLDGVSGEPSLVPAITLNKSKAEMVAAYIQQPCNGGHTKGAAINVNDNSVCKFIGYAADYGVTLIKGVGSVAAQKKVAGVVANNNSTIYFTGPTAILQYGIGILADNNSLIKACPVLSEDNASYDASNAWGGYMAAVSPVVEIHATRACAVANNSSQIRFEDLGDYRNYWPLSEASSADYTPLDNASGTSSIICSGALQFYPNPPLGDMAKGTLDGASNFRAPTPGGAFAPYMDHFLGCYRLLYDNSYETTSMGTEVRDSASRGGMCAISTGDSEIFLRNVHFPCGQLNGDQSFYDPSASVAGCNDLFMWNVQDTSRLNASYSVVSGVYPSLAGYTGPRSVYSEGQYGIGADGSGVGYGAYSGTPDTATLSVLDHFGSGVNLANDNILSGMVMSSLQIARGIGNPAGYGTVSAYGPSSYENRGPFRLFFPVKPEARFLCYLSGLDAAASSDNRPYQHLSQGYALSGACSAILDLSTTWNNLLTPINDTTDNVNTTYGVTTSGYYFPNPVTFQNQYIDLSSTNTHGYISNMVTTSPMLPDFNPAQVVLDESFANTFNNAKHCSTSFSGRKQLVTIYKPYTTFLGEGFMGESDDGIDVGEGLGSVNIFDFERDI